MRTTLDIDEDLLEEAIELSGEKSRSKAVNKVMADWIRDKRIDELRSMLGTIDLGDDWFEMRHMEPR